MGIGISIFLLAIGAILSFAVDGNVDGLNLDAVGVILMLLGGIGLLVTFVLLNDTVPWRRTERLHEESPSVVYRDEAPVQQERVVHRGSRRP